MDYRKDGDDIKEDQENQLLINWAGISAALPLNSKQVFPYIWWRTSQVKDDQHELTSLNSNGFSESAVINY